MLQSVVSTSQRILLHNQIKGGGPLSPRQLVNALAKAELAIFQTENRGTAKYKYKATLRLLYFIAATFCGTMCNVNSLFKEETM